MALGDRALQWEELGEDDEGAPAQDAALVLYHADNIPATGFLEHIKLPHDVDFQSVLELVRKLRRQADVSQTQQAAEWPGLSRTRPFGLWCPPATHPGHRIRPANTV